MVHPHLRPVLVILVLAGILTVTLDVVMSAPDSPIGSVKDSAPVISQHQAKIEAHQFLADDALSLEWFLNDIDTVFENDEPEHGPFWRLMCRNGWVFDVSSRTGRVVYAFVGQESGDKLTSVVPKDRAVWLARIFSESRYPAFRARNMRRVEAVLEGEPAQERWFVAYEQQRKPTEVAIYPNRIELSIDARTGRLWSWRCTDVELRRTRAVSIDREDAKSMVDRWMGSGAIRRLRLRMIPSLGAGPAKTVWEARMKKKPGVPPYVWIDADCGIRVVW